MPEPTTRRAFLSDVGTGMLIATVGPALAADLGLAPSTAAADATAAAKDAAPPPSDALTFGSLEPLVCALQETPVNKLNALLVAKLRAGVDLKTLTAAAALANARTFGGEDYVGFHTMMALGPAYRMSRELPTDTAPLPVFKVLYRNTNRIQEHGGRTGEVLHAVAPAPADSSPNDLTAEALRAAVRDKDIDRAERLFAAIARKGADDAFNAVLTAVEDHTEVHRVVLPYRAWDMLDLIGRDQAHTLLRQSVRYCVKAESWQYSDTYNKPREILPTMLDRHKLTGRPAGTRTADDAFVDALARQFFTATPEQAADAAAAALADGFAPGVVGEAISLAANQLILRDAGRPPAMEVPGKPIGSVHGDSIGVHACDSANAWRNMSKVASPANATACLILGAYQVALDRAQRGGDFLHWDPLPLKYHLDGVKAQDAKTLLAQAEEAVRGNLQARAAAVAQRYADLGHPADDLFALMLRYAVSEDGALHAEKFFRTTREEYAANRPAFRTRHLVALARVTASEYGRPAPGVAEARDMLKA